MANLSTKYLGLELKNPIIVGSSRMTSNLKMIKRLAELGAGAVVVKSLFEEQIQWERFKFNEDLDKNDSLYAEMVNIFPEINYSGIEEHLMWIKRTKEEVDIPVIGSLNAINSKTWVDYAKRLEAAGCDALELNYYSVPSSFEQSGQRIEEEQLSILRKVIDNVQLPVSVKLSPFYTNPLHLIKQMDQANVAGVALFNQLFQPDFDVSSEKTVFPFQLSDPKDRRLALRFSGLLYGYIKANVSAGMGVFSAEDIARMLLAGASCVQIVTTLYRNGVDYLATMIEEFNAWMDKKGYKSIEDFQGKMSLKNSKDPWAYRRAQYVKTLLKSNPIIH